MSALSDLERLESLHRDLLALSELRLLNVERLWIQLEACIEDFRRLLEKNPRNEQSRKALATGMGSGSHHSYGSLEANLYMGQGG